MWLVHLVPFMLMKKIKIFVLLVNLLRLIVRQNAVKVESDPQFVIIFIIHSRRWHDQTCREPGSDRIYNIRWMRAQKNRSIERVNVLVRTLARQESTTRNIQSIVLTRSKKTLPSICATSRQNHNFNWYLLGIKLI